MVGYRLDWGKVMWQQVMAIERWELEQLADKLHQRHQHLHGTWQECPDDLCSRIREWLSLVDQVAGDMPTPNSSSLLLETEL